MNNRLTYKEPNGDFGVIGMNEDNREEKLYSCVIKLMDYEEQGLAPSEVEFLKKLYDDSVMEQDKLRAELEKTQSRFITKVGLLIEAEYEKAKKLDYVKKPLAFALYLLGKYNILSYFPKLQIKCTLIPSRVRGRGADMFKSNTFL